VRLNEYKELQIGASICRPKILPFIAFISVAVVVLVNNSLNIVPFSRKAADVKNDNNKKKDKRFQQPNSSAVFLKD